MKGLLKMKEFQYYQNLIDKFLYLYELEKFISDNYDKRYDTLQWEDEVLGKINDDIFNELRDLCFHNSEEIEFFPDWIYAYEENGQLEAKDGTIYGIENDIDFFEFCYAYNLENNLKKIIDDYVTFGSETCDAFLFICPDNEWIDEFYTEEQLNQMAERLTAYIQDARDSDTEYIFYDGEMFSISDTNYTSIEETERMTNCIKGFCENAGIDYETYDF